MAAIFPTFKSSIINFGKYPENFGFYSVISVNCSVRRKVRSVIVVFTGA